MIGHRKWFLNDLSSRERVKLKRSLMSWGDRKFQIYEIWIWRSRTKSISDPASQPCEIYYHPKLHRFLKKQYVLPLIYHWMNRQGLLRLQRRPGHLLGHTVRISNKTIIIFRFQLNLIGYIEHVFSHLHKPFVRFTVVIKASWKHFIQSEL